MNGVKVLAIGVLLAMGVLGCEGATGPTGDPGLQGSPGATGATGASGASGATGATGATGQPAVTTGTIAGTVKDGDGAGINGVSLHTVPGLATATSAADGSFTLADVSIGSYSVVATKSGYAPFTLANVGVAAGGTTDVTLVLHVGADTPGTISGRVTDAKKPTPTALAGVVVGVQGGSQTTTTAADGSFTLANVAPGPVFLSATAPSAAFLDTETRDAVLVSAGSAATGVTLVLSARPSGSAQYIGMEASLSCATCHTAQTTAHKGSAHYRSLTRIDRTPAGTGPASNGAFARLLNPTLTSPRIVMLPLAGTITIAAGSAAVVGSGTTFTADLVAGDVLGYTPAGQGWTPLGTVQSVADDTHLSLVANATFAAGVTSLSAAKYSSVAKSRTIASPKMWPIDAADIVAPAAPGVKATNPNYDPNDPCIYGNAPAGTCAAGGTTKYSDGQVNVYLCNLRGSTVQGVTYANDEYVQKFGGSPSTCSDGSFWDGVTTPAVPLVHLDVIYGGQGDKDGSGAKHPNMGVFKQRFQGRLADVKAADAWSYTTGKNLDSLTLPIQILESGDKVSGGFKMNGYHPTEQKFPGESWSQRTRTFSHACAGCHNTGLSLAWDTVTVTLPFGRDGAPNNSPMQFAAIKSYSYLDENITCEHCHGPGQEHASTGGGAGNAIINPKYLTAEAQRQLCGKCHSYDDATNAKPAQDYGFEYPWNSDHANDIGGGVYVPGVYDLGDFFDNWDERKSDDEALWDPAATGGRLYGQAHRQQYIMLGFSAHTNNPYQKATCTSCHDQHSQYLGTTNVESATGVRYSFGNADFRGNVLCLSCHAGGGPLAVMPATGPFAGLSKDDVANVAAAGTVTRDGTAFTATAEEAYASGLTIAQAVSEHMFAKTNMVAFYDPLNDARPVGRCTSCHMPKVAKSGGYVTGNDASNPPNKALIEGDQASHSFNVVWPWQSSALSRGGPTFQSGYYGQMFGSTNVKYDLYGSMPNSCGKCHAAARRASLACPDSASIWPGYWPFSEHRADPFWAACTTSSSAP
ncbi:MAG TPA: carboxypeptidase-like regulatory domain-containing protein [Polyangia bacterium]|jgi:hypothetical protein